MEVGYERRCYPWKGANGYVAISWAYAAGKHVYLWWDWHDQTAGAACGPGGKGWSREWYGEGETGDGYQWRDNADCWNGASTGFITEIRRYPVDRRTASYHICWTPLLERRRSG